MTEALVIIDMQYYFETARHESTIRNCIKQIKKAIKDNIPIIVVEYWVEDEDLGETLPRLQKYFKDYNLTRIIKKHDDNGGREVNKCLKDNDWNDIDILRVCGVNINCCVASTVNTLMTRYYKQIKIIKNACNGDALGCLSRKQQFERQSFIYESPNMSLV